jgi:hypothetical protein
MRNTILAIATTLVLAMGTVPTFAAEQNNPSQSQAQPAQGTANNSADKKACDAILADRATHTADEIKNCETK